VNVVDSHVHFWDPSRMDYPWLARAGALRRAFQPEDLDTGPYQVDSDTYRLDAAVFVEAGRTDAEAGAEVAWVEELAARWPVLRAVVAHAPVERGADAAAEVAALARHRLVTGVRRNVQGEPAGYTATGSFTQGVRLLAGTGLTFDLCVRHDQIPEVTRLAQRVPEVTFVLDHLGKPPVASGVTEPWRTDLARLADQPNTVCKLSGLATEAAAGWTDADVLPYLRHALAVFGPDRCLFGGDWPVATLATTYPRWLRVVAEAVADRPDSERHAVFAGTARRIYRIEE